LIAFWHADLIALLGAPWSVLRGTLVMVSRSRDGDLAAGVARRFTLDCARGGSSAGSVPAALEVVRSLRKGGRVGLAVDGPRGPRARVKTGIYRLSQLALTPGVIPVAARASHAVTLRSWDRLVIPLPFSRVQIVWGGTTWRALQERLDQLHGCAE
jgi:lysophospholipid acyltransferase (LPLAT)-like uncharacterized protein